MKFIKWALQVPLMLLLVVATYILAPVLVLLGETRDGYSDNNTTRTSGVYLPDWLSLFQMPDNSLDGDEGWRTEHWQWRFKLPTILAVYVGRVGWLWRNPGYGFGLITIDGDSYTERGNRKVSDSPFEPGCYYIATDKYWQFKYIKQVTETKCFYMNLGWNIQGALLEPKGKQTCTFAFSPRPATIKR